MARIFAAARAAASGSSTSSGATPLGIRTDGEEIHACESLAVGWAGDHGMARVRVDDAGERIGAAGDRDVDTRPSIPLVAIEDVEQIPRHFVRGGDPGLVTDCKAVESAGDCRAMLHVGLGSEQDDDVRPRVRLPSFPSPLSLPLHPRRCPPRQRHRDGAGKKPVLDSFDPFMEPDLVVIRSTGTSSRRMTGPESTVVVT